MSSGRLASNADISRQDPDFLGGEVESLSQWLDYHRSTLLMKCSGLSDDQLKLRPLPPSRLSLLGLLRHLTEVERGWFAETLAGEAIRPIYYTAENPDGDFESLESHTVAEVMTSYRTAVDRSREIFGTFDSMNGLRRNGAEEPVNVRWVAIHMIEEYARHNGHADLIREAIDGATGE